MTYPFNTIWKLLKKLPRPDRGDQDSWRIWYEKSWSYLGHSKLIAVNTDLDITRAKLVALALCWIVNDFVGATYEYNEDYELYWKEWYGKMEISPLFALVILTETKTCIPSLSNAEIYQDTGNYSCEESLTDDSPELESDLSTRICSTAALDFRTKVIEVLRAGFGDSSLLFANLYMASQGTDPVADFQQRDLEELEEVESDLAREVEYISEREELEARRIELESMGDEAALIQTNGFDELSYIEKALEEIRSSILNKAKLEKRREELLRLINREDLEQLAYEESVNEILNGNVRFCDDEYNQRLKGMDWCLNGCWIVNSGSPSVYRG